MKQPYILNTKQFSDKIIGVDIVWPYNLEDYTHLTILCNLLGRSTKKYSNRDLKIALEELYNIQVHKQVLIMGKMMILRFEINYINLLNSIEEKQVFTLIKDLLFNPNIINNEWNELDFRNVMDDINHNLLTRKENPHGYAQEESLKFLAGDMAIGAPHNGDEKIISQVTPKSIVEAYHKLITKANHQYFAMGDFDQGFQERFKQAFRVNNQPLINVNDDLEFNGQLKIKTESLGQQQTVAIFGYHFSLLTDFERNFVLPAFNELLVGHSVNGRLFTKIRKERGLAYYVYSKIYRFNSLLMIITGIAKDKTEEVQTIIKEVMDEFINGDFSNQSLTEVINNLVNDLEIIEDKKTAMFNYMINVFNQLNMPVDQASINLKKIQKNDIQQLAKKLKPVMIYILAGEQ